MYVSGFAAQTSRCSSHLLFVLPVPSFHSDRGGCSSRAAAPVRVGDQFRVARSERQPHHSPESASFPISPLRSPASLRCSPGDLHGLQLPAATPLLSPFSGNERYIVWYSYGHHTARATFCQEPRANRVLTFRDPLPQPGLLRSASRIEAIHPPPFSSYARGTSCEHGSHGGHGASLACALPWA